MGGCGYGITSMGREVSQTPSPTGMSQASEYGESGLPARKTFTVS